jgi:hypothetical protein
LRFKVGDGSRIFIWHDIWHLDGCLLDKYGYRIIQEDEWFSPYARSKRLVEIQSKLLKVVISAEDLPIWNSRKGIYACSKTWESLKENEHNVCELVENCLVFSSRPLAFFSSMAGH